MLKVEFESIDDADDSLLKYAVIVSRYQEKWLYCKHKERNTWEIPGGKREPGEPILETAKRELFEETGVLDYTLYPVCAYCVAGDTNSYGLLCYAEIKTLGSLPSSEIERIHLFDNGPELLTYPHIQPFLFGKVRQWLAGIN